jgi:uncharacterized membrane protein YedE/YeeE
MSLYQYSVVVKPEAHVEHFTPFSALLGGALLGLAACLLLLAVGRIAGISGIVAGLLAPASGDRSWRLAFVLGLVAGCIAVRLAGADAEPVITAGVPELVLAGLLVGFGTRLGNGCTSGHGVCGLARLSPRSLAATATFMATGAFTVFVMRHGIGG